MLLAFILATLNILAVYAAGDIALPAFEKQFLDIGIGQYNQDSYINLMKYLKTGIETAEDEIEKAKNIIEVGELETVKLDAYKDHIKDCKLLKKFYKHALQLLTQTENLGSRSAERVNNFNTAKRIIYSVISQFTPFTSSASILTTSLNAIKRLDLVIPYVNENHRDEPINLIMAQKEAKNLVSISESDHFLTAEELAQMSVNEIADLDISPKHISWMTEKNRLSHPTSWQDLENWTTKKMKDLFKKDNKLGKNAAAEYSIENAKKVLFFKEIKITATSPKVDVEDVYGNNWKLKWGNEMQIEPVNNRLYMKLGSKFTDLVYANKRGEEGLVLILGNPKVVGSCNNINTYKLLRECLLNSKYKFDVAPYTLEKGIIDASNSDRVLKNLSKYGQKKYQKVELQGRTFVTFYESMVEFKNKDFLEYGGPVASSTVGATDDRVARGLLVFNMWINNIDAKDDNSKSVMFEDDETMEKIYVEYQHDLGSSMGNPGQTGRVNGLKNSSFVTANKTSNTLEFNQWLLYRPLAWEKATFADAMWMAKKIATLKKSDLEEVFSYSLCPDFLQQTFVRKMQVRRNAILQEFGLTDLIPSGEAQIPEIDIKVSLKTPLERKAAASKYNLNLDELNKMLQNANQLNNVEGRSAYVDVLVRKSRINSCEKSVIINLLEKGSNPSGVERRIKRSRDDKPLMGCTFEP